MVCVHWTMFMFAMYLCGTGTILAPLRNNDNDVKYIAFTANANL